jgi:hypothetical protein
MIPRKFLAPDAVTDAPFAATFSSDFVACRTMARFVGNAAGAGPVAGGISTSGEANSCSRRALALRNSRATKLVCAHDGRCERGGSNQRIFFFDSTRKDR